MKAKAYMAGGRLESHRGKSALDDTRCTASDGMRMATRDPGENGASLPTACATRISTLPTSTLKCSTSPWKLEAITVPSRLVPSLDVRRGVRRGRFEKTGSPNRSRLSACQHFGLPHSLDDVDPLGGRLIQPLRRQKVMRQRGRADRQVGESVGPNGLEALELKDG